MDDSVSFGLITNMEGSITPPVSPREDFNFDAEDRHRPNKRSRRDIEDLMGKAQKTAKLYFVQDLLDWRK